MNAAKRLLIALVAFLGVSGVADETVWGGELVSRDDIVARLSARLSISQSGESEFAQLTAAERDRVLTSLRKELDRQARLLLPGTIEVNSEEDLRPLLQRSVVFKFNDADINRLQVEEWVRGAYVQFQFVKRLPAVSESAREAVLSNIDRSCSWMKEYLEAKAGDEFSEEDIQSFVTRNRVSLESKVSDRTTYAFKEPAAESDLVEALERMRPELDKALTRFLDKIAEGRQQSQADSSEDTGLRERFLNECLSSVFITLADLTTSGEMAQQMAECDIDALDPRYAEVKRELSKAVDRKREEASRQDEQRDQALALEVHLKSAATDLEFLLDDMEREIAERINNEQTEVEASGLQSPPMPAPDQYASTKQEEVSSDVALVYYWAIPLVAAAAAGAFFVIRRLRK